jgi:hypothetical protein
VNETTFSRTGQKSNRGFVTIGCQQFDFECEFESARRLRKNAQRCVTARMKPTEISEDRVASRSRNSSMKADGDAPFFGWLSPTEA